MRKVKGKKRTLFGKVEVFNVDDGRLREVLDISRYMFQLVEIFVRGVCPLEEIHLSNNKRVTESERRSPSVLEVNANSRKARFS